MNINGIYVEPQMLTGLINLVFVGWIVLVGLAQVYKKLDLVEDLLVVTLILLVGLRFTLLGMQEKDLFESFLIIPLSSGAFRILRLKLGR